MILNAETKKHCFRLGDQGAKISAFMSTDNMFLGNTDLC